MTVTLPLIFSARHRIVRGRDFFFSASRRFATSLQLFPPARTTAQRNAPPCPAALRAALRRIASQRPINSLRVASQPVAPRRYAPLRSSSPRNGLQIIHAASLRTASPPHRSTPLRFASAPQHSAPLRPTTHRNVYNYSLRIAPLRNTAQRVAPHLPGTTAQRNVHNYSPALRHTARLIARLIARHRFATLHNATQRLPSPRFTSQRSATQCLATLRNVYRYFLRVAAQRFASHLCARRRIASQRIVCNYSRRFAALRATSQYSAAHHIASQRPVDIVCATLRFAARRPATPRFATSLTSPIIKPGEIE
jgi:hypothetical protein